MGTTGQNYLWTSGAPVLEKGVSGEEVKTKVFWCPSKLTTRERVTMRTNYQKDNCLAFVKADGNFEVKNCAQKFHFFCEVSIIDIFKPKLLIFLIKYNCKHVNCPRRSECLKRVFINLSNLNQ